MTNPNNFFDAAFWESQGIKPIIIDENDEKSIEAGGEEIANRIKDFLKEEPTELYPQPNPTDNLPK
jgi:hypothetical protein